MSENLFHFFLRFVLCILFVVVSRCVFPISSDHNKHSLWLIFAVVSCRLVTWMRVGCETAAGNSSTHPGFCCFSCAGAACTSTPTTLSCIYVHNTCVTTIFFHLSAFSFTCSFLLLVYLTFFFVLSFGRVWF